MRLLEDSLAEEVLSGRVKDGDKALVDIDDNKVTINISSEESQQGWQVLTLVIKI